MGGPEPVIPVIRWISDLPAHLLYKSELIDCTLNLKGLESIEDRTSPLRKKRRVDIWLMAEPRVERGSWEISYQRDHRNCMRAVRLSAVSISLLPWMGGPCSTELSSEARSSSIQFCCTKRWTCVRRERSQPSLASLFTRYHIGDGSGELEKDPPPKNK
jgi:hypothetical protein